MSKLEVFCPMEAYRHPIDIAQGPRGELLYRLVDGPRGPVPWGCKECGDRVIFGWQCRVCGRTVWDRPEAEPDRVTTLRMATEMIVEALNAKHGELEDGLWDDTIERATIDAAREIARREGP